MTTNEKKCSIWWCESPFYAHGYCQAHWLANHRFGSPYGANPGGQQRIDEVIEMAKRVSKAVIDVQGLTPECPFCHWEDGHKPDCPVIDAELILQRTQ